MAGIRRRLIRDVQDCCGFGREGESGMEGAGRRGPPPDVSATLVAEDDLSHLKGKIRGPVGTPYSGGMFQVDIEVPAAYPFEPPKMKFDTLLYHPNVSSVTGAICLDILKDAWTPVLTIKAALLSVLSLLETPNPEDPQDAEVANLFLSNFAEFERTARYWTEAYAIPQAQDLSSMILPDCADVEGKAAGKKRNQHGVEVGVPDDDDSRPEAETRRAKARRITQMGFVESDVQIALEKCDGDEQKAVEALLT